MACLGYAPSPTDFQSVASTKLAYKPCDGFLPKLPSFMCLEPTFRQGKLLYRLSRSALHKDTGLSFTYWNFNNGLSRRQPWIDPHSSQGYGLLPYCRFRLPPQSHYMCRSFRPLPLYKTDNDIAKIGFLLHVTNALVYFIIMYAKVTDWSKEKIL